MGKVWHPECFRCTECHTVLSDNVNFYTFEGKPYCENDFKDKYATRCVGCKKAILPGPGVRVRTLMGQHYHWECMRCEVCNDPIGDSEQYRFIHGHLFCIDHYSQLFLPQCVMYVSNTSIYNIKTNSNRYGLKYYLDNLVSPSPP